MRIILCLWTFISGIAPILADEKAAYDLQLEDLLKTSISSASKKANTQVTLASKKSQSFSATAAAIYVISNEDIKRSGATNLPDVLRMAPGLDVARIDANKWAVSARGFNARFSNKLLVLIDGRSIYTQTFSGVYWENQDVLLEDVDRIEIIRGPGAALWGANAVNGVINIITKHSADTLNSRITAGGGSHEQGFGSFRYGAELSNGTTARAYVKGARRGGFTHIDGTNANDSWDQVQGGFRLDSMWTNQDAVTVMGDIYYDTINQATTLSALNSPPDYTENFNETIKASGGNLQGQLKHILSPTSDFMLQAYYTIYNRNEIINHEIRQTANIDFQHNFAWFDWHEIVWGLNYRFLNSQTASSRPAIFAFDPLARADHYFSIFAQDEMALIENSLWLTLGSKFEHNDYSGFEFQPTLRLMWTPYRQHYLWTAFSRAVRTPSTIEADLRYTPQVIPPNSPRNPTPLPIQGIITGSSAFKAEELLAYEIGYRTTVFQALSFDITAFYNQYQSLHFIQQLSRSFNGTAIVQPLLYTNGNSGETYGFEASTTWQMLDDWRWELNYSYLKSHLKDNSLNQVMTPPRQKIALRSAITPMQNLNLDIWFRYMDQSNLPYSSNTGNKYLLPSYLTMDIRLAWKLNKNIELSLTGQNLLDHKHLEFIQETFTTPTEIDRSIYGKIVWQY